MRIGIIGAMKIEVDELKSQIKDLKIETISNIEFCSGELFGNNVVVAVSGIGKVNAAMCAQTMILKYSPKIIINTGVAAGISGGVKIGDVVIGEAVIQHDMDTSPLGDPIGMISGINIVEIPCSSSVVKKLRESANSIKDLNVYTGIIATGDQFINKVEDLDRIVDQFGAMACEMEGASIGQVCYINAIDFAVVRAISDSGDDSSDMHYEEFMEMAANTSIEMMKNFLQSLS